MARFLFEVTVCDLNQAGLCRRNALWVERRQYQSLIESPQRVIFSQLEGWNKRMRVELFHPDSETEPRHWVRHDQAFAMMLRPGSIEWGSKRSALEKFDYGPGDLALPNKGGQLRLPSAK